ncbi:MAG: MazG-like family protein [Candidatus Doudnabacteria bacterium]
MTIDLSQLQKVIHQNKVNKGFNVTDIKLELLLMLEELAELSEAVRKEKRNVGEEIADVMIYCLGLCEILGINAQKEILRKVKINQERKYVRQTKFHHQKIT